MDDFTAQAEYTPSEKDQELIALATDFFSTKRPLRQPYELTWAVNAAMFNGLHYLNVGTTQAVTSLRQDDGSQTLIEGMPVEPGLVVNFVFPKTRARLSKFLKGRPQAVVIPPSPDRDDVLHARGTQKALDYAWRKHDLETAYHDALTWSAIASKSYWAIYWDPYAKARIKGADGKAVEVVDGDVCVDVVSPFEIFPEDITRPHLKDQRRILRARMRDVEEMRLRYPEHAKFIGTTEDEEAFHYERQIGSLSALGPFGRGITGGTSGESSRQVLVLEYFQRPTSQFPDGRYVVVVGGVLVKKQDELPYGFADMANPFPFVEFNDTAAVGRFYPTTIIEQITSPNREYNKIRRAVHANLEMMIHPKILAARQHQIAEGAWTNAAGEVVEFTAQQGVNAPNVLVPPNVASDAWRTLDMLRGEIDSITQIYPSSEGAKGDAKSGFQTSLLQEAADMAHAPDIRQHERSIEEAALKIRRLMKRGYTVPRLITVIGRSYTPEVLEFSQEMIDEAAEVVVQAGSGLPQLKAARIQSVLELYDRGMLGDQADPEVKRRSLGLLDVVGLEEAQRKGRLDEDLAKWEIQQMTQGIPVNEPEFFQNHMIHFETHTDDLKSTETQLDGPDIRKLKVAHVILHMKFFDPLAAFNLAQEYGLTELIPVLQAALPPPPPPGAPMGGPPPQGPPPPPGPPPAPAGPPPS